MVPVPVLHERSPGHKQSHYPERRGCTCAPSIPIIEESLPDYEDYHGVDVSLDPKAEANISGDPLRDREPVVLTINQG